MGNSRTKNAKLNIIFSLLLQFAILIKGLVLPRMIIPVYGSDVNGAVVSITQFLAYISLLEGGVGSVFRSSLYKPLARNDMDGVSGIINEQKRFYKKIGFLFVFYVIALCAIYPLVAKTNIEKPYIISLILILSVGTFTEYFVSLPYVSLLSADQKIRINYTVDILYTIANIFVTLFWVMLKADIRFIYLSMCIIGLLRPLFYTLYVRKHYKLNKETQPNKEALNQRWNGMVHHFAYYIHTNTSASIITIFVGVAMVSVYNVYAAIIFGICHVINSISTGTVASFGNLIATENEEQINKTFNKLEIVQCGATTILYTITSLLLIPFVKLYTVEMTDVNYIQPIFGYILIFAEAIYCFRCVYSAVSQCANKFKETQLGAILECVTNIATSLILVAGFKLSLMGVVIGTAVGMSVRYVFEVIFLSKNVIFRSTIKALKMLLVSVFISIVSIVLCNVILDYSVIQSAGIWVLYAIITTAIVGTIAIITYFAFYKDTMKSLIGKLRKM